MDIRYVEDPGSYRPGNCNIGPAEVARRRVGAMAALATGLAIAVVLLLVDAPPPLRIVVFPPLAAGLISLEQVRRRFCVGFALAGIRDFGPLGTRVAVDDDAARAADRRAALGMVAYMSALAAILTLAFVVAPI